MPLTSRTLCATCTYEAQGGKRQGICCGTQHVRHPHLFEEGQRIAHVEFTLPIPPAELSPEVQAALGEETPPKPLLVAA